ncbi:MAG: 30S ribosomal protein S2 [Candidatus Buchananbacteria bacterium]
MQQPTLLELLQSGVHFGHQDSRWHPKMKPYIFATRNGIHIIDLEKTQAKLNEATSFIQKLVSTGGVLLFVGTKKQGKGLVKAAAESCGMPYVVERWLGGIFTNFANINRLVKKYLGLIDQQNSGALAKYTKKEQSQFQKEIKKLQTFLSGLTTLNKLPQAVFILDLKKDKTALNEARKKKIPVIAICDTNVNPDLVDYPIPANDDAVKAIALITNYLALAVNEGKQIAEKKA